MSEDGLSREWIGAFGHELRSPIAAILGYAELVHDGALGAVDPRAADAAHRIAAAAEQLIVLLDGVDAAVDGAGRRAVDVDADAEDASAAQLIARAVDAARADAESRSVELVVDPADVTLHTDPDEAMRALHLVLGAAIKASPGGTLRISAVQATDGAPEPGIVVRGSGLRPGTDGPEAAARGDTITGGGIRLMLANEVARRVGGRVVLESVAAGSRVVLVLPRLGG